MDSSYQLAVLLVSIHIPGALSLKDKRMVLRSLKDKARDKFNVTISELDGHDKWQVATLGFGFIGNDRRHLESCVQNVMSLIESYSEIEVCESSIEFL